MLLARLGIEGTDGPVLALETFLRLLKLTIPASMVPLLGHAVSSARVAVNFSRLDKPSNIV